MPEEHGSDRVEALAQTRMVQATLASALLQAGADHANMEA
jgi:hypothetical protein